MHYLSAGGGGDMVRPVGEEGEVELWFGMYIVLLLTHLPSCMYVRDANPQKYFETQETGMSRDPNPAERSRGKSGR